MVDIQIIKTSDQLNKDTTYDDESRGAAMSGYGYLSFLKCGREEKPRRTRLQVLTSTSRTSSTELENRECNVGDVLLGISRDITWASESGRKFVILL